MAILHIDGFDHYGLDTARMTEGPYDQVDAAFTLSEVNPRTGARCLRRDSSAADAQVLKDLMATKLAVGVGFAASNDSLPNTENSYIVLSLQDENGDTQILFRAQPDGRVDAEVGGAVVGSTEAGVLIAGEYQHFEFGVIANTIVGSSAIVGILNEDFESGLGQYTFDGADAAAMFTIVEDDFGAALLCDSQDFIGLNTLTFSGVSESPESISLKFKVTALDVGAATVVRFLSSFGTGFTFYARQQSTHDALQRSAIYVGVSEINIGSVAAEVGEWYSVTISVSDSELDCTVTKISDSSILGQINIVGDFSKIDNFRFSLDKNTPTASVVMYDDIIMNGTVQFTGFDGVLEIRKNGVTELSLSGIKTRYTDSIGYDSVSLRLGSSADHGVTTDIDDFYIWDDQGAWNNSFIGDRRCFFLKPNQDTNIADFDPSSGSFGYKMIDDDSPDDDTTYIIAESYLQSGSPLSGTSEFEIQDLPDGTSLISAVSVVTRASKTDATSAEIFTSINSGVDSLSQSAHALTMSYLYYGDMYEYDPATIANMTRDGFNALTVSITADDLDPGVAAESPEDDAGSPTDEDVVIPQDFVARYLFEDFAGNVAIDETGNFDGTVTGATVVTGPGGSDTAADLGSGKFISLPTSLIAALGSGPGTLSIAIRPKASSGNIRILSASDQASTTNFLATRIDASTQRPDVVYNSVNQYRSDDNYTINIWGHLIIRTDGTVTSFRVNGVNTGKVIVAGSDTGAWFDDVSGPDNLLLGRFQRTTTSESVDFEAGYLTLYDRELSDAECESLETEY